MSSYRTLCLDGTVCPLRLCCVKDVCVLLCLAVIMIVAVARAHCRASQERRGNRDLMPASGVKVAAYREG